ncbi:hypothetical protein BCR32DRAFT_283794 [Anaeromyces robustus]|uniref:Uncharacterized protein n=1 Tax=Anaeromyces robustus TaxID=1754192 RepID=A0A1Y1WTC2_9FUNG|nr:hypothetical protein BCR32DRAFT_283794 [Anaeromyces robustus]|eukprot:ORX76791.1 hypothetical protein BCR32DRAFT_283794 [Anaeromyces robustus]
MKGCSTFQVSFGYYINAEDSENPIIKCEKGKYKIEYCYDNEQLKFYPVGNSTTTISTTKTKDYYTYASIPINGFPIIINKNDKLIDLPDPDQSDTNLYDCNDETKFCTLRPNCTLFTYMYISENHKAFFNNEFESCIDNQCEEKYFPDSDIIIMMYRYQNSYCRTKVEDDYYYIINNEMYQKNNNSTEESKSTFDLVCIQNYVPMKLKYVL